MAQIKNRYTEEVIYEAEGLSIKDTLEKAVANKANLRGADLIDANLSDANLSEADLSEADLSEANLIEADLSGANLIGADLSGANLIDANLIGANLHDANLIGTDLIDADLIDAGLIDADLSDANLIDANLSEVDLSGANLSDANLSKAYLFGTRFLGSRLEATNLLNSEIASTIFARLKLDKVINIETVVVRESCIIDFETIKRSPGLPHKFLHKMGYSELALNYIPDLFKNNGLTMFPVFLSHSWANKDFAGKLYEALIEAGVQVWYDEKKMKPSDDIYEGISRGINVYDKLILVCSKDSLNSWWVNEELNRIFKKERDYQKEEKGKERLLIPITIDDTIFSWEGAKAESIKDKIIGDFRGWEDDVKFEKALRDLIMALNVDRKEIDPKSFL